MKQCGELVHGLAGKASTLTSVFPHFLQRKKGDAPAVNANAPLMHSFSWKCRLKAGGKKLGYVNCRAHDASTEERSGVLQTPPANVVATISLVARTSQEEPLQTSDQRKITGAVTSDKQRRKGIAPLETATEKVEGTSMRIRGVLCTSKERAQCKQCIHPPLLFGHSCKSRSPISCVPVGNHCHEQRPKLVRPSVSFGTGIPGAFSGC